MPRSFLIAPPVLLLLAACGDPAQEASETDGPPIRGVVTVTVSEASAEDAMRRRYPGVLEPKDITSLSFEVGGRLGEVDLTVGQRVDKDAVIARLDSAQFEIEIENRTASVDEARILLAQSQDDLERAEQLLARGSGTKVTRDSARTDVRANEARLRQAEESLRSAKEDLADSILEAPFDGIINAVDAESFATVSAGTVIASIYEADEYEVSFSVNFDTVSQLELQTEATVRLADDPSITLAAEVSELGERADTVSSFPVIVRLKESNPVMRAGMAVEVNFNLDLPVGAEGVARTASQGFLIPLSAAIPEGQIPEGTGPNQVSPVEVFVYNPEEEWVERREVMFAGIRESNFIVVEGLDVGDRVAVAGVPFLRNQMKVRLIETEE